MLCVGAAKVLASLRICACSHEHLLPTVVVSSGIVHCLMCALCTSGDIGGSMGLFIGASVMTIYEIVDLILNYVTESAIIRMKRNKRQ